MMRWLWVVVCDYDPRTVKGLLISLRAIGSHYLRSRLGPTEYALLSVMCWAEPHFEAEVGSSVHCQALLKTSKSTGPTRCETYYDLTPW